MPSPATTSAAASAEVIQGAGRPPVPPRPGAANVSSGYGSYGAGKQRVNIMPCAMDEILWRLGPV